MQDPTVNTVARYPRTFTVNPFTLLMDHNPLSAGFPSPSAPKARRPPAPTRGEVNRVRENTAWGSYRTEFYPTHDYKAIGIAAHESARAALDSSDGNDPEGSAKPRDLFLGHDALDVFGLALDTIARTAIGFDRQAGDDGVDATFLHRGAALRALLLVMNVVIDREVMGHRRSSC